MEAMVRLGLDAAQCFAYGDHREGLTILRVVGNPRVVGGDPLMAELARDSGWPVLPTPDTRPPHAGPPRSRLRAAGNHFPPEETRGSISAPRPSGRVRPDRRFHSVDPHLAQYAAGRPATAHLPGTPITCLVSAPSAIVRASPEHPEQLTAFPRKGFGVHRGRNVPSRDPAYGDRTGRHRRRVRPHRRGAR
ncbi:hypothetical protein GCM10025734_64850 [Kitasatospora paranensis]